MNQTTEATPIERVRMDYDVVIVGGGPAGLSTAYRLKTEATKAGLDLQICVLEKGSEIGAHILSGAVFEPDALSTLIPDWKEKGAPLNVEAKKDEFLFLTKSSAIKMPTPPHMKNHGNYIISLGDLCRFLGEQCENVGVEILPGFPAADIITDEKDAICGVITGDFGIAKDGNPKDGFEPGVEIYGKYIVIAEGTRGSLSKNIISKYNLDEGKQPQTYGIGIKELWQVTSDLHEPGKITHTIGWPVDSATYGGSFIYHLDNNRVAIGYVIGLDYQNPYMSPFEEFQRFKTHPKIRPLFEGGKRLSYGARALNEGGIQSMPDLVFPGGMLVGCAAGMVNVPKIKGSHNAVKSGILAADNILAQFKNETLKPCLDDYQHDFDKSDIHKELHKVRNIRPSFKYGLWGALAYSAIDTYVFWGHAPWTLKHHGKDHESLIPKEKATKIHYPKPDNKVSFDRLSSVFLSGTNHEEDQPVHLVLGNHETAIKHNYALYDAPEQRYCPAGVYEIIDDENGDKKLQINAQNCVHCKTCDIKDPTQNINWETPEGGGGPNYSSM